MQALAVVGFSNLTELQGEVVKVIPGVNARIEKSLHAVNHPSLPAGIAICCYFERTPTGRVPIHMRRDQSGQLIVRLDIVAPNEEATVEAMLDRFLAAWADMLSKLTRYLERRQVPSSVVQLVVQGLSLPSA